MIEACKLMVSQIAHKKFRVPLNNNDDGMTTTIPRLPRSSHGIFFFLLLFKHTLLSLSKPSLAFVRFTGIQALPLPVISMIIPPGCDDRVVFL